MPKMKRVYHPTVNAWQDVPADSVKDWTESGWKSTKPGHVNDDGYPPVGEGYQSPAPVHYEDAGVSASRSWAEPNSPVIEPEPPVEPPKGGERKTK